MAVARAVSNVFIVAAKRTAFGTYGGALSHLTATDLQEKAASAALEEFSINKELINSVIIGNVLQSSKDTHFLSRHLAVRLGLPTETPCMNVNRLCGSGFQSIVSGVQEILCGDSKIVLTGGADNMSLSPFALRQGRFGIKLGMDPLLEDTMWHGLIDYQIKTPMGVTAENLAEKYNITREDCDAFAIRSQQNWKAGQDAGHFKAEIVPITVKGKKGPVVVEIDEHPKPKSTIEAIAKLPPVFKKGGTVSAANASGICDGAACVIIASEEAMKQHNLTPLARVAGYSISGCDPHIMGIGPVPVIRGVLKANGLEQKDIDLFDINEAFAPQYLAVEKELGLDPAKCNVNGGAIAMGHPVGASGNRITGHLAHHLKKTGGRYAIGSACIGGGQGIAILLESV